MSLVLDFDDKTYAPQWWDFETGEVIPEEPAADDERVALKIRPPLSSKSDLMVKEKGVVLSGKEQCRSFKYSLMAWRNVIGANSEPLLCDDKTKQKVFDHRMGGIPKFVMERNRQFDAEVEEEKKIS